MILNSTFLNTTKCIIFIVYRFIMPSTPIREFKKLESIGVPFANSKAMTIYSSLWNVDDWLTQGGHIKTDCKKRLQLLQNNYVNYNYCTNNQGFPKGSQKSINTCEL
ncbi:Xyloglucan endotransglucosylase/hydrolase protein 24 [Bienertia sinuspersici]